MTKGTKGEPIEATSVVDDVANREPTKPSLGRIVLFRGEESNGATEHPALVTRVHEDGRVNLSVFLDASTPIPVTNVENDESGRSKSRYTWRWPPKV